MSSSETVRVSGHIIDSLILAKILDVIVEAGANYRLSDLKVGTSHVDPSSAELEITAGDPESLAALLTELHPHGVVPVHATDAVLQEAEGIGVMPEGFYSTTNLPTAVRVGGKWIDVARPEMDCALVVDVEKRRARTEPMHRVRQGDLVTVGTQGVRVKALEKPREPNPFQFMSSEVSSEKPKGLLAAGVAGRIRGAKDRGGGVLAVCGPAVIHTGAAPDLAALIRGGWIDLLFAGNGFAVHDIESALMGTSLGVSVREGTSEEGAHANHLRTINRVRRWGSIAAGVESGELRSGVMYECVSNHIPFVLAGSIRDDGPLPGVITDVMAAQDAMRSQLENVQIALMLASTLHAIATGNLLQASVETYCVDINQAVVTKLSDRGSHQTLGIVTDAGLFLRELAQRLAP